MKQTLRALYFRAYAALVALSISDNPAASLEAVAKGLERNAARARKSMTCERDLRLASITREYEVVRAERKRREVSEKRTVALDNAAFKAERAAAKVRALFA